MVFHGDYEIKFEIYEAREGRACGKLLGHMAGVDAYDAKTRWAEAHEDLPEQYDKIVALYPKTEWR